MVYSELNDREKNLFSIMREIGFGRIENHKVRNGQIESTAASRKISTMTFDREDALHTSSRQDGNFILSEKHLRFLKKLRLIGNGTIQSILIQAGLPVRAEIEETVTSI